MNWEHTVHGLFVLLCLWLGLLLTHLLEASDHPLLPMDPTPVLPSVHLILSKMLLRDMIISPTFSFWGFTLLPERKSTPQSPT